MNDELQKYLGLPYKIDVVPEACTDGSMCYRASHPELPGCMSHGLTPEEAIENLAEAQGLYIETLLEKREPVPTPSITEGGKIPIFGQEVRVLSIFNITPSHEEVSIKWSCLGKPSPHFQIS